MCNYSMSWGGSLKIIQFDLPCHEQQHLSLDQIAQILLQSDFDGASTTFLGNPQRETFLPCTHYPCTHLPSFNRVSSVTNLLAIYGVKLI